MNRYKTFVFLLALNLFIPWEVCHSRSALAKWFPGIFLGTTIDRAMRTSVVGRNVADTLIGVKPGEMDLSREERTQIIYDFIKRRDNPYFDRLPYLGKAARKINLYHNRIDTDTEKAMIDLARERPGASVNAFRLAQKISTILEEAKTEYTTSLTALSGPYNITFYVEEISPLLNYERVPHTAYLRIIGDTGIFSSTFPDTHIKGKVFIDNGLLFIKEAPGKIVTINLRGINPESLDNFRTSVVVGKKTLNMSFKKIQ